MIDFNHVGKHYRTLAEKQKKDVVTRMKNTLRNNGDTFIIERSSMKVKAPDD